MNPAKIAAIILIISIGLIAVYSIGKNFLMPKNQLPAINASDNYEKQPEKLAIKSPIQWLENNQEISEPSGSLENKESTQQFQVLPDINSKIQNFLNNIQVFKEESLSSNTLGIKEDNAEAAATENYYKNFLEALDRANFTSEELALMKKNEEGRPLLLEELLEQANQGTDLNELRTSFSVWHQLDERVLAELSKLSLNSKTSLFHQTMVNWFSYHSRLTKQFSEENFSKDQINQLVQQFKKDAEAHNLKLKQSLTSYKGLKEELSFFVAQVQAFTCGALVPPPFYHFGGRVVFMEICNYGMVETISPPCGGLLYFSWPVLAGNPYLWKKPIMGSAILGRSIVIPGACGAGACSPPPSCTPSKYCVCFPYEAAVLYFGTSLTP